MIKNCKEIKINYQCPGNKEKTCIKKRQNINKT